MSDMTFAAVVTGVCTIIAGLVAALVALPLVNWRLSKLEEKEKEGKATTEEVNSMKTDIAVMKNDIASMKLDLRSVAEMKEMLIKLTAKAEG